MTPSTARIRRGLSDLARMRYRERWPLRDLRMLPLGMALSPEEAPIPGSDEPGWRSIAPGDRWGGYDENAWFHGEGAPQAEWGAASDAATALVVRILLGISPDFGWPEGLLYANGQLLQGVNQHHEDVLLPATLRASSDITFDVRAWSGMTRRQHTFEYAELALLDRDAEALYHLLSAGCDLLDALDASDPLRHPLAQALESAYNELDLREPVSAGPALQFLRARLAELRAAYTARERPTITAVGHGHLDVAWLWQTRHTREKAARTFSIATALMGHYPEYHFLHTTPQVFAWLERDYPDIFARTRARVAEERFEAGGAMWVESDTNIVCGESLVRQIMYGQRYLRETFGAEYDALWLPDTFGYTWALPQIMLRSGLRVFMTTKMSWSDTNRIPHDTFRWRGLDGSETLAHFVTTPALPINPAFDSDTYNARLDVPSVRLLWERYREKAINHEVLLIYGHGDGGAGPTRQSIESYRALRELPGLPEVQLGRADHYFHALRERVWPHHDLPTWDGELYLEFHRGVYTTQAWLKRLHRQIEGLLLLAESIDATRWAAASEETPGETPDARPMLDDAWRTLLTHEFHDILPGSSIGPVYSDARATLTTLADRLEAYIAEAERDLAARAGSGAAWLLHNPSPCATPGATTLARLPLASDEQAPAVMAGDRILHTQVSVSRDGGRELLVECPAIAGRGWLALRTDTPGQHATPQPDSRAPRAALTDDGGALLESALYRLRLNANGEITSLIDKRVAGGRELLIADAWGNRLLAFDDRPRRFGSWDFDAWDLDETYEQKPLPLGPAEITLAEVGPLRLTVRVRRIFRQSVIEQDISLCRDQPRIDFATHIDWHEHHVLLKVAFPLDLRVTLARSEIQYGSIARPTHRNTSWDSARFETVAHRWVDLSESGYGVALLNDGRYGHDIQGSVVRLSLLRSPTFPDPDADQGAHDVTYSLLPHLGAWPQGDVVAHGYALNRPQRFVAPRRDASPDKTPAAPQPLFWLKDGAVILEAVKRAAEGDDLIVRLYESAGSRTSASVHCALPIERVVETDLLERPLTAEASPAHADWQASRAASHDAPAPRADGWTCAFRPFEIRTFRVTLRRPKRWPRRRYILSGREQALHIPRATMAPSDARYEGVHSQMAQTIHPMTLTQKILAHHAVNLERPWAQAGDILRMRVDWTIASELAWNGMDRTYTTLGRPKLHNPDRFYLALDHTVDPVTLANDARTRKLVDISRDFAKEAHLKHFYDANVTIMHTRFYRNLVQPGEVVLGADSHTSSHGGLGAFAMGLGGADITVAMTLGETWLEVPEAIAVDYDGELPFGITGKDVILRTLGTLGRNTVAMERTVEFRGAAAHAFSTDMRFTICNMTAEFGGLNGIFEADEIVAAWLAQRRRGYNDSALYFRADDDAPYIARYPIALATLAPQVAKPFSPDNVFDVTELTSQALDGVFIGACTTTEEELALGALVLEAALAEGAEPIPMESGRRIVVPGDLIIRDNLASHGLWAIYERAGFVVDPPGCSMCLGIASRKAGHGETWLSSQNRNFENRMGEGSLAWLASAATVAASALDMRLTDPRALLARVDRDRLATILQRKRGGVMPEITTAEPAMQVESAAAHGDHAAGEGAVVRARVQRFGDAVDTDAIIPGEFCHLTSTEALGEKAFYYVRPEFRERARSGATIIVAEEGWGSGSSREMAVWALQGVGIQAIIAKSYAFIHKRNLVNEALPFLTISDPAFYALVGEGAELEVDLSSGVVRDVASGQSFQAQGMTPMAQALQAEGGLVPAVQRHGAGVFSALTA